MSEKTLICCHAPSLALLLFETVCTSKCQKGLLLGSIRHHVETSATDEKETNEEKKTVVYIEHCVPITDERVFSPYGELNGNYLSSYKHKIVGWYTYRPNLKSTRCTLQESLIHQTLLSNLENANRQTFPLALISASTQESLSTHSFSQTFLRLNDRNSFERIPMKIFNLSDKVSNSSGYLRNVSFPVSNTFKKIMDTVPDMNGVSWVKSVQNHMIEGLRVLNAQLIEQEKCRALLEADVSAYRKLLQMESTEPDRYTPGPCKNKLPVRLLKYDPVVQYGGGRLQNLMQVSEDEEEEQIRLENPPDVNLDDLTKSLRRRMSQNYQQTGPTTQESSVHHSGSGDAPSPVKRHSMGD